eukprot:COSAG02_NODE_3624_length_6453_cov_7.466793_10_plen_459_part_00
MELYTILCSSNTILCRWNRLTRSAHAVPLRDAPHEAGDNVTSIVSGMAACGSVVLLLLLELLLVAQQCTSGIAHIAGIHKPNVTNARASSSNSSHQWHKPLRRARTCDPLEPEYCMLPFPNDFWRVDGRLALSDDTFPRTRPVTGSVPIRAADGGWNELDGAPIFPGITTFFAGLTDQSIDNMARVWNPQLSLENEANPSVILDTSTQQRVAHWAEVDHMSDADATLPIEDRDKRALLLWPTHALAHSTTYIVALRAVRNRDGELVQPSAGFAALRDRLPSGDPLIEERRQQYDDEIFPMLLAAGVAREDLQLAWSFTTVSLDGTTSRLQLAKDDAFERLPAAGVDYEITEIEENPFPDTRRRITGRFAVPLYLSNAASAADSRLLLDEAGQPQFQGFHWWPFQLIIPSSCGGIRGCRPTQVGHGLFGSYTQVSAGYARAPAEQFGYITFVRGVALPI